MYNEELLKKLMQDFGEANTILFCKMESAKYTYLFQDCLEKGEDNTCTQYDFERDWWKMAETNLNKTVKSNS
jgi:hypothetical protein